MLILLALIYRYLAIFFWKNIELMESIFCQNLTFCLRKKVIFLDLELTILIFIILQKVIIDLFQVLNF